MASLSVLGQPWAMETLIWIYEHPGQQKTRCVMAQDGHGRLTIYRRIDDLTNVSLITQTWVGRAIILDVTERGARTAEHLAAIRDVLEATG